MAKAARQDSDTRSLPNHERHFYALNRAIGRFGMRVFTPYVMETPHWHGHIEANYLTGASMTYQVDGRIVVVPPDCFVIFWAGIPHQLTDITPQGTGPVRLSNIYLPLDTFLFMPHIAKLQVALLGGGIVGFPGSIIGEAEVSRWYRDYRSNDFERTEVMKMEMNACFRRVLLGDVDYLLRPFADPGEDRALSSTHIRHVIAMVRFILENLAQPMTNADVAAVTGLHQNYALAIFTRTMRLSLKQFIIRMRLLRARALMMESTIAISTIAEQAGFTSISQFYDHFRSAYGVSPHAMREKYTTRTTS